MGIENFIREAIYKPNDYIAYHVGRELAELYPGKTVASRSVERQKRSAPEESGGKPCLKVGLLSRPESCVDSSSQRFDVAGCDTRYALHIFQSASRRSDDRNSTCDRLKQPCGPVLNERRQDYSVRTLEPIFRGGCLPDTYAVPKALIFENRSQNHQVNNFAAAGISGQDTDSDCEKPLSGSRQ
jgi:hypothetical protein